MPVSDERLNFKQHRGGGFDSDQENRDHHDQIGHDGMHYDAQRAMIYIGVN